MSTIFHYFKFNFLYLNIKKNQSKTAQLLSGCWHNPLGCTRGGHKPPGHMDVHSCTMCMQWYPQPWHHRPMTLLSRMAAMGSPSTPHTTLHCSISPPGLSTKSRSPRKKVYVCSLYRAGEPPPSQDAAGLCCWNCLGTLRSISHRWSGLSCHVLMLSCRFMGTVGSGLTIIPRAVGQSSYGTPAALHHTLTTSLYFSINFPALVPPSTFFCHMKDIVPRQ